MDIIYFHGECPDGWCAAMIAHAKYRDAQLIPLSYGSVDYERMLEEVRGKKVLMLDFSLKTAAECDGIYYTAESFHIYDHHKSAEKIIGGMGYATFDMERSGAGLTWDYLFGADSNYHKELSVYNPCYFDNMPPLKRPWYVDYTEDQDLWRWKLPHSREINGWLNVQERTPTHWWEKILTINNPEEVVPFGEAIQQQIAYSVTHAVKDLQEGVWVFEGRNYRVGVANTGVVGISNVGEAIYNAGYDIAIMWRECGDGLMRFGLRSKVADVGAMASSFPGGGGHRASSGFELSVNNGRSFLDEILGRNQLWAAGPRHS